MLFHMIIVKFEGCIVRQIRSGQDDTDKTYQMVETDLQSFSADISHCSDLIKKCDLVDEQQDIQVRNKDKEQNYRRLQMTINEEYHNLRKTARRSMETYARWKETQEHHVILYKSYLGSLLCKLWQPGPAVRQQFEEICQMKVDEFFEFIEKLEILPPREDWPIKSRELFIEPDRSDFRTPCWPSHDYHGCVKSSALRILERHLDQNFAMAKARQRTFTWQIIVGRGVTSGNRGAVLRDTIMQKLRKKVSECGRRLQFEIMKNNPGVIMVIFRFS